uniref:(northern house mosquito) hypothetical protein n=1 Tax=Culex pipiens TaxID=7175 RepID=A0A8D8JY66_CULPI
MLADLINSSSSFLDFRVHFLIHLPKLREPDRGSSPLDKNPGNSSQIAKLSLSCFWFLDRVISGSIFYTFGVRVDSCEKFLRSVTIRRAQNRLRTLPKTRKITKETRSTTKHTTTLGQ